MGRKRAREADGQASEGANPDIDKMDQDESSDDEDFDVVNVDFEWFNFDPEVDFHGVKTLLRQLFDVDAPLVDVSAVTDAIIEQRTIGSAVKVDGKANDAYAFLTVLNLPELLRGDRSKAIADLMRYLAARAESREALVAVAEVLREGSGARVGLVLAERLINMPAEIAPAMFSMLVDEVEAAVEDGEPYDFSHYLVVSKTYQEVQSSLEDDAGKERKRKKAKDDGGAVFFFHPEDEVLQKHAESFGSYEYTRDDETVADSKRAFQDMGVKSHGSMILIQAAKFEGAVKAIGDYLSPPA